jgi:hypothetical protein
MGSYTVECMKIYFVVWYHLWFADNVVGRSDYGFVAGLRVLI